MSQKYHFGSCGFIWYMDLACIFWCSRSSEWPKCPYPISSLRRSAARKSTQSHIFSQWPYKRCPPWVNVVCKVVWLIVCMAIDWICDSGCFSLQQFVEDWRLGKDIYVILSSWNTKKCMPNPCIKWSHCFQNDAFGSFSVPISSLPCTWTVFPSPVHAVDASNHAKEDLHLTLP